ncbi:MAG: alpha/beta hydrolase [Planctomycetota bacterium]|jgi:pimeloyl-ACP methyl ester carboxylesterase
MIRQGTAATSRCGLWAVGMLLAGWVCCSAAQEVNLDFPEQTLDQWQGFTRHKFQFEGREAWVVEPQQPRAERLFSWCLIFPDAFTERCAAPQLLAAGCYHVYCDVGNTFGAPEAIGRLGRFHDELCRRGLAKKAVLIGISRGGLYAHNYAVAHPERVSVIYGDAAVLDFKSWPGGLGVGKGSSADWRELLKLYEFQDEAAAKAYTGNPVDQLEPLQKAGVALIYVVGDADDVVPWSENTQRVETRYRELGGVVEVLHKPEVGHHPHGLDDPAPVVQFILKHAASK